MAGRWPVGKTVRYFADMPEPFASWYDQEWRKWGAFGIVPVERVYSVEEADVHAYFVDSLPNPTYLALTQMPDPPPAPGVALTSEFLRNPANGPWDEAEFREAAGHEEGHSLGLDHNNDPRSILTPVDNRVVTEPSAVDQGNLQAIYPESVPAPAEPPAPDPGPPRPPPGVSNIQHIGVPLPDGTGAVTLAVQYFAPTVAPLLPPPGPGLIAVQLPTGGVLAIRPTYAPPSIVPDPAPAPAAG